MFRIVGSAVLPEVVRPRAVWSASVVGASGSPLPLNRAQTQHARVAVESQRCVVCLFCCLQVARHGKGKLIEARGDEDLAAVDVELRKPDPPGDQGLAEQRDRLDRLLRNWWKHGAEEFLAIRTYEITGTLITGIHVLALRFGIGHVISDKLNVHWRRRHDAAQRWRWRIGSDRRGQLSSSVSPIGIDETVLDRDRWRPFAQSPAELGQRRAVVHATLLVCSRPS